MKTIKNLTADQIRKSILQLAIQGKLVKQNPDDEPASELVKKIYAEKKRLIAEGKIKKDKSESFIFKGDDNCYYEKIGKNEPVKLEDLPFDIPDNWAWVRFGNLVDIQTGASFSKGDSIQENKEGYIRVLRGGNIIPFKYLFKPDDLFIPTRLINDSIRLQEFDLITPAVTSLENIGKVAVIDKEIGNTTAGGFVYIFRPFITNIYISLVIMNFMSSSLFQKLMKEITKKSGQAFYNMNKERLKDIYFPIPPLDEQQRIVDKINSFEPLLQRYEEYEKKLTELESAFSEKLKKSILQYAIEGKLVKQDPNDEPASVLLERIKAEKESLIKAGIIKRDKNESYIYQGDDKNYYEKLPALWSSEHLSELMNIQTGASFSKNDAVNEMKANYVRVLRGGNILPFCYLLKNDDLYIPNSIINKDIFLKQNDIITPAVTSLENIGKIAVINKDLPNVVVGGFVYIMKPFIDNYYFSMLIMYFMSSPTFLSKMISITKKSGQAFYNMNKEKLKELILPIPGMNEIKSLVTKINYLFKIIDSYQ